MIKLVKIKIIIYNLMVKIMEVLKDIRIQLINKIKDKIITQINKKRIKWLITTIDQMLHLLICWLLSLSHSPKRIWIHWSLTKTKNKYTMKIILILTVIYMNSSKKIQKNWLIRFHKYFKGLETKHIDWIFNWFYCYYIFNFFKIYFRLILIIFIFIN